MAKRAEEVTLGIDVSKQHLEVFVSDSKAVRVIDNDPDTIGRFLSGFSGPAAIAVEATNVFHEALVALALARGFTVYRVVGYKLNKDREAVGIRAKTDASDAYLIHRYLVSERAHLRALSPQSQQECKLWRFINDARNWSS